MGGFGKCAWCDTDVISTNASLPGLCPECYDKYEKQNEHGKKITSAVEILEKKYGKVPVETKIEVLMDDLVELQLETETLRAALKSSQERSEELEKALRPFADKCKCKEKILAFKGDPFNVRVSEKKIEFDMVCETPHCQYCAAAKIIENKE